MRIFAVALSLLAFPAAAASLKETKFDSMCGREVSSPEAGQAALRQDNIPVAEDNPQYIAYSDQKTLTIWTFTKPGNKAHPAAVCRQITQTPGGVNIAMQVMCGAEKEPCDAMVEEFKALNEKMKQGIKQ
jgi:hypothetical protein